MTEKSSASQWVSFPQSDELISTEQSLKIHTYRSRRGIHCSPWMGGFRPEPGRARRTHKEYSEGRVNQPHQADPQLSLPQKREEQEWGWKRGRKERRKETKRKKWKGGKKPRDWKNTERRMRGKESQTQRERETKQCLSQERAELLWTYILVKCLLLADSLTCAGPEARARTISASF